MPLIRTETPADYEAVSIVNERAFNRSNEARLVETLRTSGQVISLVAEVDGRVVGHILFSPIVIETSTGPVPAISLAPMAVLPEFQKRGIGSALVRRGIEACRSLGHAVVIVLGHPDFYPRFGFVPARPQGIEPPFPAPDEAWMVQVLRPGALENLSGTVRYPPAFAEV
jgi:putative acetyltransferase